MGYIGKMGTLVMGVFLLWDISVGGSICEYQIVVDVWGAIFWAEIVGSLFLGMLFWGSFLGTICRYTQNSITALMVVQQQFKLKSKIRNKKN